MWHCVQYDLVWYSDDSGATYTVSETVLPKMDEAQLVELSDGRVMANMRNNHLTSCDCRAVAISSDGGKTFGNITYGPTLISPVCYIYSGTSLIGTPMGQKKVSFFSEVSLFQSLKYMQEW